MYSAMKTRIEPQASLSNCASLDILHFKGHHLARAKCVPSPLRNNPALRDDLTTPYTNLTTPPANRISPLEDSISQR